MTKHSPTSNFQEIFDLYQNSVFAIQKDIYVWESFLKLAIKTYSKDNSHLRIIYQIGFSTYNLDHASPYGRLNIDRKSADIYVKDLEQHRKSFFNWVMTLALLKVYNSVELLFLQAIHISYFSGTGNVNLGRKQADLIHNEIRNYLISNNKHADTKNNKHIIELLKLKSPKFKSFFKLTVRSNFKTTREDFFAMISILRHVVTHNGMIVTSDVHNEIKSRAKDVFEQYFELEPKKGYKILCPIDEDKFLNFLRLINDFSINTAKFIFDQSDLKFIGLQQS